MRPVLRALAWSALWLASLGTVGYAVWGYVLRPIGSTVHPAMMAVYNEHRAAILTHVACSALALLLGPAQFMPGLRKRNIQLHRLLGRLYLSAGVLPGALAGMVLALHAFGGPVSTAGFAALDILWLATGFLAYRAARLRRIDAHRRWMVRNFALTLAAVTIRAQLGACFAAGWRIETFFPILTWTCWVPNLLVAEWVARRR